MSDTSAYVNVCALFLCRMNELYCGWCTLQSFKSVKVCCLLMYVGLAATGIRNTGLLARPEIWILS